MNNARPAIDDGDPPGLALLWQRITDPAPGRLENSLRVLVLVLIAVAIGETFRIPEIAVSAYVVLFVSRAETASTVVGALIAGVAVILAVLACIVVLMASLSESVLRIPLIAAITFVAMFLARAGGTLAPAFFAAGFIVAYGLTLGDQVVGLALQPGSVANVPEFTLPELAFVPPEEALVHFLLWLALVVALPVGLVILANLLTGRDPALILRAALAARLEAAARFCEGAPGAERELVALAREGTAELLKLRHLASLLHRSPQPPAPVAEIQQLLLLLIATGRATGERDALAPISPVCRSLAERSAVLPTLPVITLPGMAAPLAEPIAQTLRSIAEPQHPSPTPAARGLLAPDAFTNPDHGRFALKVTLAVLLCYAAQNLLDWPGIHTCIITCFFVALGTVGETAHKAALRLTGCLIGAALGIGAILVAMPAITDLGGLLLLLAPVTLLAAWIGFGSERIAYAGWQIALAFYLSTLQGFGPTLDMETARDRVVGILLGNLIIFLIFTTIWPVSVARVARAGLAKAIGHLAALFRHEDSEAAQRAGFAQAVAQARAIMVNDAFETQAVITVDGRRPIDAAIVAQVQALIIPISVILDLRRRGDADPAYEQSLAAWFSRAAAWVAHGDDAADVVASVPDPPAGPGHLAAWYWLLIQDIRAILDQVGQAPDGATAPRELRLVPG